MVEFFRDTIDGGTYTLVVFGALFVFFACIGYLVTDKIRRENVLPGKEYSNGTNKPNQTNNIKVENNNINQSNSNVYAYDNTSKKIAVIFLILTCISSGLLLFPLIWLIPMIKKINKSRRDGTPLTNGFKWCVFIFGNFISGILLLCDKK